MPPRPARPPRRARRGVLLALLASSLQVAPAPARAAGPDDARKAEAGKLLADGLANYEKGELVTAAHEFEEAYRVFPSPKILYNLGTVYRDLKRLPQAANAYDRFLAETANDPSLAERRQKAQASLDALRAQLGKVEVRVKPPEAAVTLDGQPFSPLTQYLPPGTYRFSGACPACVVRTQVVSVPAGATLPVDLDLTPEVVKAPPKEEPRPTLVHRSLPQRMGPLSWAGVGLVAVGGVAAYGGGFALVARSEARRAQDQASPEAKKVYDNDLNRFRNQAILGFGLAGLAVGGGVALVLLGLGPEQVPVAVGPAGSGAGLSIAGRF